MDNINITKIESYLRGKMTPQERALFESALASDPELLRRTEELREFAYDLRQVARSDIRKRVEAVRDQIKQEESEKGRPPKEPPLSWIRSVMLLAVGTLLGLSLGWLLFHREPAPLNPNIVTDEQGPVVASLGYEEIARIRIPGPQPGKAISLTVLYKPSLDLPNQPVRMYALDSGGTGLCVYARLDDDFWKKQLELSKVGTEFFLKIDNDKFLLVDNGEELPFPEKPTGN